MSVRVSRVMRFVPLAVLTFVFEGCPGPPSHLDAGADSDIVHTYTEPRCTTSGLVPFRDGVGGNACDRVGAGAIMASATWPDVSDLGAPIAYVQNGAPAGADGTMAHPYPDIAAALSAMPMANAIVLAAGTYMVPATVAVSTTQPIEIRGAGAIMGTTLVPVQRMPVFTASGSMTMLTLSRLAIRIDAATSADTQANGATAASGAQLFLREVAIEGAYDGVVAQGSFVDLGSVTITGTLHRGVSLSSATDGTRAEASMADTLVRDGLGQGIVSDGARLAMVRSAVLRHLRGGMIIRGGDEMMPMSLDTVTVADNSVVGLSISGSGASMTISQLLVTGTHASSDGIGGDGLSIGAGATVTADLGVMGADNIGNASAFVANERAGIMVSGDAAMPAPMGGNLQINGALVASNRGGGIFVQNAASVPTIAFSLIADNLGIGIASTTQASIGAIATSQIVATRNALVSTGAGDVTAGDGLSIADGPSTATLTLTDDEFSGNARFAAILASGAVMLSGANGHDNGFPIGVYGANVTRSGTNDVGAAMPAPTGAPPNVHGARVPAP